MKRATTGLFFATGVLAVIAAGAQPGDRVAFDGAAALRHVAALVALGPRPAGSPASARARDYIVRELRRAGVEARVERFDTDTPHGRLAMANVVGIVRGRRPDTILVGGHYDTKWFKELPFVGANDGGSSTALLLELARRL
ncbi:MAG TPA: M28 family peptidase, partial [Methylomirabilota bacterium]|nr:M28 family peptidase [Methylomirabilota bacterium]